MPKRPARPSLADEAAAPGGAAGGDHALILLKLFGSARGPLQLSELAERAKLYKSTTLRLLASLEHAQLVARQQDNRYVLGPCIPWLHAAYSSSFSLEAVVLPELRVLVDATAETAAFHVRQGDHRVCLYRVDSPQPVREHVKVGDVMPLDSGAGGRVLMAYAGAAGALYASIRRSAVAVLTGDRVPEVAGISSPVFDASGILVGAVTLTMPKERLLDAQVAHVLRAARGITQRLGGRFPVVQE
jgi:DNA-binding IclR family transcriptional regulator